jgi:DNA-binding LytR/AlgR family response regulator
MEKQENVKNENPQCPRPGGNNVHTPAKPPSKKLKKALANLGIIILIRVERNILHIFYPDKPEKTVKGTLKAARLLCNTPNFMKTHKSFIANLCFGTEFFTVFENYEMQMTNGETVIIGNDY